MLNFRNIRLCFLASAIVMLVMVFAGGWTLKAEGSELKDLGEAPWAQKATVEMVACGVVTGYPDAVYKPYNNVTMLEAVTMLVRMLGLEDQAEAAEGLNVNYRMPAGLNWGRGYLITAVNLGILDGNYLYLMQPNSPATRTEVAMLAFHALKLEPAGGALVFSDADQIPGEYRDGVAAVVKKGIMQGYPGNMFKPEDNINRAQMAVLMSNIVELGYADPCPADRRLDGIVLRADQDSGTVYVEGVGVVRCDPNCGVFRNETGIASGELRLGEAIQLILNENGHAVYINVRSSGDRQEYKGVVNSILAINDQYWLGLVCADGTEITLQVAAGVKLDKAGSDMDVSTLNKGEYIEIKVVDNKITTISSLEPSFFPADVAVKGIVSDLVTSGSQKMIKIREGIGVRSQYDIARNAIFYKNGIDARLDDISIGAEVKAWINDDNEVIRIEMTDGRY
ncbi:MAG: S-layer homology domain-containing protein [Peptococcaceae bacterium]|nr:S-layer homology domain-containing protein [Peptococcaceae bacterium]